MTTLTDQQMEIISEFFGNFDDLNEVEDYFFDLYDGYLRSSNEEEGTIPSEVLRQKLFLVREILKMLKVIKPLSEIKQAS